MQILIPTVSRSAFFPEKDYFFPKTLIEIAGRPMIELVVSELRRHFPSAKFTFVADQGDVRRFSLDRTMKLAGGKDSHVVEKFAETSGGLCSCLLAIDGLDLDQPLLIANSDQVIFEDLAAHVARFEKRVLLYP